MTFILLCSLFKNKKGACLIFVDMIGFTKGHLGLRDFYLFIYLFLFFSFESRVSALYDLSPWIWVTHWE